MIRITRIAALTSEMRNVRYTAETSPGIYVNLLNITCITISRYLRALLETFRRIENVSKRQTVIYLLYLTSIIYKD